MTDDSKQCLTCGELTDEPLRTCHICHEPVCEDCWLDHLNEHRTEDNDR